MKSTVAALALVLLALGGGFVAARGAGSPPVQDDPLLQSGIKRYAAYVREETASLRAAEWDKDALGARIYAGRIAPSVEGGVDDPVAVALAAAALLSKDARGDTALLDIESHAAGATAAFDAIRDAVWARDRGLVGLVDDRMATLREELDRHRRGAGFVPIARVSPAAKRRLLAALDALAWRYTAATRALG